jgi:hypothetical protein
MSYDHDLSIQMEGHFFPETPAEAPTDLVAMRDHIMWTRGTSRLVAMGLARLERLRAENSAAAEEWRRLCAEGER